MRMVPAGLRSCGRSRRKHGAASSLVTYRTKSFTRRMLPGPLFMTGWNNTRT